MSGDPLDAVGQGHAWYGYNLVSDHFAAVVFLYTRYVAQRDVVRAVFVLLFEPPAASRTDSKG